jgi:hypothetical protein
MGGGGTVILVKRHIKHSFNLPKFKNLEATGVCSTLKKHCLANIIYCYKSPGKGLLKEDLYKLFNNTNPVIVCGDLNSKHSSWNSRENYPHGKILAHWAENNGIFVLAPFKPTHCAQLEVPLMC